jgi:hypothetical protein
MSWSIANLENTVEISKELSTELFKVGENYDIWYSEDEVTWKGKLQFNPDHSEHMDYLQYEDIKQLLIQHKVEGRITFGSLEGDNAGDFWGYEFYVNGDGDGAMSLLTGRIEWTDVL